MKKVLVTGASGLIGSAVIPFLKERGFELYALSTKRSETADGVCWLKGDLFDRETMEDILAKVRPEYLLHLAWQSTGNFDGSSNYEFLAASVNLLEAFAGHGGKRVVMAGTYAEYGYQEGVLEESRPAEPINAYSRCKSSLCDAAQDFCSRKGLSFGWARIFSVYGRESDPRRLTADVIHHLNRDETVTIRSGSLIRDYIYVKDAGAALACLLDGKTKGIVNICTGKGTSIHDYVMTLARAMHKEDLVRFEEQDSSQQTVVVGSCVRLNQEVGFTPVWTMEDAVQEIVAGSLPEEARPAYSKGLVSVLLSIYNVEEYLEECLDSLLRQSYTNLEIICVNNGSPDGCAAILERYAAKDDRIKIVTLKENRKLCGGRNAGLDHASGEYICFVDPDDWVEEEYIKSMVDAIETKKDPDGKEYQLIVNYNFINYTIINNNIKILYGDNINGGHISLNNINKDTTLETNVPMWGRLYRASFLQKYKIRFLDGFQTDNIPYAQKLLAHMGCFYGINTTEYKQSCYWRRMLSEHGALTDTVLYKNMEIPDCLENLYDYLKAYHLEKKLRVMFFNLFILCFPCHKDMPGYYLRFKHLAEKMEKDIKTLDVYNQDDINLCNLLIYTNNFFQFCDIYFRPAPIENNQYTFKIKLFNKITLFKKKYLIQKTYYHLFGVPLIKTRVRTNRQVVCYLFKCIPIFTISR
ncbi:NAD-dependent epimerase/dehydratase family protein [uncultured Mailhella sp.]|uniref:NAD-dependent epimerase/dehydratase family protein n=1 Tax=uncultured Mailhella sp. TaxID=1981031 RepID=UPI0026264751|nr:NAD-dependent epimerase/dehydratase family protein [uncultured Mailhella sp.]